MALTKVNTDLLEDGGKLDGIEAGADVTDTANVTAAGALMDSELTSIASVKALNQGVATTDSPTFAGLTTSADVSFGDNDKAIFGAGSDLQIYHDGSNSYIDDAGTGNLRIRGSQVILEKYTGETILQGIADGSVYIFHDNAEKLATTSTGIDVTGTATMDGLTVSSDTNGDPVLAHLYNTSTGASAEATAYITNSATSSDGLFLQATGASFTTIGGFVQDAAVLGSGTGASGGLSIMTRANADMRFYTNGHTNERMRIDSAGNVQIGTGTPAYLVGTSDIAQLSVNRVGSSGVITNASRSAAFINVNGADGGSSIEFTTASANNTQPSERMRIDSSGNLLVGTTNTNPAENNVNGISLFNDGRYFGGTTSNEVMRLNRKSTDGHILIFHRDGTAVGSIGASSGNLTVNSSSTGLLQTSDVNRYSWDADQFYPAVDNNKNLGHPSYRFKDLYLSGAITAGGGISASPLVMSLATNNSNCDVTMQSANSSSVTRLRNGTNDFQVHTNGTERMRIDASGNLLVGTTNSSQSAGIGTKIKEWGSVMVVNDSSTGGGDAFSYYSTASNNYKFWVNANGQIAAISTSILSLSDQRFKENIRDLDDGLSKVMQLQPRKFDWKEGEGKNITNDRGFIAQEFEEVFPDLVDEWKDEAPEGEEPYKAVSADLIPTLVKAIQEQQTLIESLTARIAALEE